MGATKEMLIRMSEAEYLNIPPDIRESHLRSKIVSESVNDFEELMKDDSYRFYNVKYKAAKNLMEERAYQLREQKRKNNLNK